MFHLYFTFERELREKFFKERAALYYYACGVCCLSIAFLVFSGARTRRAIRFSEKRGEEFARNESSAREKRVFASADLAACVGARACYMYVVAGPVGVQVRYIIEMLFGV